MADRAATGSTFALMAIDLDGLKQNDRPADRGLEQADARQRLHQTTRPSGTLRRSRRRVLLLDRDNFKQTNDQYGHAAGDQRLTLVAQTLQAQLRESDIVARLGGEEFAVLLPQATAKVANVVIEKLTIALTAIASANPAFKNIQVHASIGLALESATSASLDALLSAADDDMYRAKRQGVRRLPNATSTSRVSCPGAAKDPCRVTADVS